jgi:hypothetical protein
MREEEMTMTESYLGDGLYASFDGFAFTLRAPRENGDHFVILEPLVLREFIAFVNLTGETFRK